MEFHPDVYKRACSKLNAPPDAVKEAIKMIEQKRKPRKAVRNLLVTAAILALVLGGLVDALQKRVVPRGLRKGGAGT